jgi:hypothetical protein
MRLDGKYRVHCVHREFNAPSVAARLQARAGIRYYSSTLAIFFGVETAEMTKVLHQLHKEGKIRAVIGGSHTVFYLPSAEELRKEQAMQMQDFRKVPEWNGQVRSGRVMSL